MYIRNKITALLFTLGAALSGTAQPSGDYRALLESIERQNPEIQAARKAFEASRIGVRTGLNPADPSVEMEYGLEKDLPVELSVTQSFDFPTVYRQQNRIAKLDAHRAELEYWSVVRETLTAAKRTYVEAVYLNKKLALLRQRYDNTEKQAQAYRRMLEAGDANILEKNNIEAVYLNVKRELRSTENALTNVHEQLRQMNGGAPVSVTDTLYPRLMTFGNEVRFVNDALEMDYGVMMSGVDTLISQHNLKLSRSLWAPGFEIGYKIGLNRRSRTENVLVAGITLPLWQNRNKVRYARLQETAVSARRASLRQETRTRLQTLFNDYRLYTRDLEDYRQLLGDADNVRLLEKALEAGEISLLEYIVGSDTWYGTLDAFLEVEKQLAATQVEMSKYFE